MTSTSAKLRNAGIVLALIAGPLAAEGAETPHAACPLHAEHSGEHAATGEAVGQVGHGGHVGPGEGGEVGRVGQGAFGELAAVAGMLEADPATDWSRVDLDRLREHLVDMSRVALEARVEKREVPGGFAAEVTGAPPTAAAIRRMVAAHGRMMDGGAEGWEVAVAEIDGGVRVTVTDPGGDASRVAKLRGLGFFGFLTAGGHHRPHHLAMAAGRSPHAH